MDELAQAIAAAKEALKPVPVWCAEHQQYEQAVDMAVARGPVLALLAAAEQAQQRIAALERVAEAADDLVEDHGKHYSLDLSGETTQFDALEQALVDAGYRTE